MTLHEAIHGLLIVHNIGDHIYDVRERAFDKDYSKLDMPEDFVNACIDYNGSSWDHPLVLHYGDCIQALGDFLNDNPPKHWMELPGDTDREGDTRIVGEEGDESDT
jgi:hypothetical protein